MAILLSDFPKLVKIFEEQINLIHKHKNNIFQFEINCLGKKSFLLDLPTLQTKTIKYLKQKQ